MKYAWHVEVRRLTDDRDSLTELEVELRGDWRDLADHPFQTDIPMPRPGVMYWLVTEDDFARLVDDERLRNITPHA